MNMIQFMGAIEIGLIYALVALGVYLSFRVLDFPDLSVDGTFPMGAAVCATLITKGVNPGLATLIAMLGGAAAGYITAWMSTQLKMLHLLAGILTMTALYSINLHIMGGRPNVTLLGVDTLFTGILKDVEISFPLVLISIAFGGLLYLFLSTRLGLAIRATGINPRMARAQGIDDRQMVRLGLALSNALVACAGALFAQVNGFADVTMGVGTIIMGLAAVIIGEAIFPIRNVLHAIIACILGAIVYRFVIALALNAGDFGLQASDQNLVTAVIMALAMLLPNLKRKFAKGRA